MSSPKLTKRSDFDLTIGRELQSWAGRQQAPPEVRRRVLEEAAALEREHRAERRGETSGMAARPLVAFRRFRQWLHTGPVRRKPQLPYSELSQWLFNQAMWHNLGNDRRAVRFVC